MSGSNSEYARTRKRPRDACFPAASILFDAELAPVDVKPRRPVSDLVRAPCGARLSPRSAPPPAEGLTCVRSRAERLRRVDPLTMLSSGEPPGLVNRNVIDLGPIGELTRDVGGLAPLRPLGDDQNE